MAAGRRLSHDEFFEQLVALFNDRKGSDHGAIYLTQKRLSQSESSTQPSSSAATPSTTPFADLDPSAPLPVLIRATNGKSKRDRSNKVKLSTVVEPHDLAAFYLRYADVCKAGMAALKPRDRSKKKEKAKAKKKKAAV